MRRRSRWTTIALLVSGGMLGLATAAVGAGTELTNRRDDLEVTVDSRWAGSGSGGYYPLRISVVNHAADRRVTFRLQGQRGVPTVVKQIDLPSNVPTQFTLLVPMVSNFNIGRQLVVEEDGRWVDGLEFSVSLPQNLSHYGFLQPSVLVISPDAVDFVEYDQAVHQVFFGQRGNAGRRFGPTDREAVSPVGLPRNWLAYSGLDAVVLSLSTLQGLGDEQRGALLDWVETGGTLFVTQLGTSAERSPALVKTLGLDGRAAQSQEWQPARPDLRQKIPYLLTPKEFDQQQKAQQALRRAGHTVPGTPANSSSRRPTFNWPAESSVFAVRRIQQGAVVGVSGDPFEGNRHDWQWLFRSLNQGAPYLWKARHGMSSRTESQDFLGFRIPGVESVPVFAFLSLITVFAIVIGPVNYLFLRQRGQLFLLVLTVPLIAILASVGLVGFTVVSHGFDVKSRTRSVTFLDQETETAVTTARVSLFAGLAPSVLEFDSGTAVYPIWPPGSRGFEFGTVDWTRSQQLGSGWIKTRNRTQFLTVQHRSERGRVNVKTSTPEGLAIENGLTWKLGWLVVRDEAGKLYLGRDIPANKPAVLVPVSVDREELQPLARLVERDLARDGNPQVETVHQETTLTRPFQSAQQVGYGSWSTPLYMLRFKNEELFKSRSFVAVIDDDVEIQRGVRTSEKQNLHVLVGSY